MSQERVVLASRTLTLYPTLHEQMTNAALVRKKRALDTSLAFAITRGVVSLATTQARMARFCLFFGAVSNALRIRRHALGLTHRIHADEALILRLHKRRLHGRLEQHDPHGEARNDGNDKRHERDIERVALLIWLARWEHHLFHGLFCEHRRWCCRANVRTKLLSQMA